MKQARAYIVSTHRDMITIELDSVAFGRATTEGKDSLILTALADQGFLKVRPVNDWPEYNNQPTG